MMAKSEEEGHNRNTTKAYKFNDPSLPGFTPLKISQSSMRSLNAQSYIKLIFLFSKFSHFRWIELHLATWLKLNVLPLGRLIANVFLNKLQSISINENKTNIQFSPYKLEFSIITINICVESLIPDCIADFKYT